MGIAFQDFVPAVTETQGAFGPVLQYTDLTTVVSWADVWIEQEQAKVINIETLVLPNAMRDRTVQSDSPKLKERDDKTDWFQVVRVWYRT